MRKLAFVFALLILAISVNTALGLPGSGTQEDPWRIESLADFNEFAADPNYWDGHTRLETDVNLAGQTYSTAVIAPDTNNSNWYFDGTAFTGVFDGNGHKITALTIYDSRARNDYLGLFGYIDGGEVKNLGIENCSVTGGNRSYYLGGLVGSNYGSVSNCNSTGDVNGRYEVGGLLGFNAGSVSNCYSTCDVSGPGYETGGLVGFNWHGSVSNCHSTGSVSGGHAVGGLAGYNIYGSVSDCYSTGDVSGYVKVGGLVGENHRGSLSNCYSTGDVSGNYGVGGLVGDNFGSILNCYSSGDVSGYAKVGGLVGGNFRVSISSCYSTGSVSGVRRVGGLVGTNGGSVSNCFWDTQTSGMDRSGGGTGKTTAEMQDINTYLNAGWDFVGESANGTDDIWLICQGVDYPRLWWEFEAPVLEAEPEESIWTSNVIMWSEVSDANAYWAECAEDANFQYVVDSSGWISQTSYVFFGLETGVTYWYRVKAGYYCDIESRWSNVESSTQVQLRDAVLALLEPNDVKNENMLLSLANKLDAVQGIMDKGQYKAAISKLENDILQKTDGCAETGAPDKNDWITTCERQELVYPIIIEIIELLSDG